MDSARTSAPGGWFGLPPAAACIAVAMVLLGLASWQAVARPQVMRPGVSFYSDEYVEKDGVFDIGPEKNYEEVYNNYAYYETVYDTAGRVIKFVEYVRGEVERVEHYLYSAEGEPVEKTVVGRDGKKSKVKL